MSQGVGVGEGDGEGNHVILVHKGRQIAEKLFVQRLAVHIHVYAAILPAGVRIGRGGQGQDRVFLNRDGVRTRGFAEGFAGGGQRVPAIVRQNGLALAFYVQLERVGGLIAGVDRFDSHHILRRAFLIDDTVNLEHITNALCLSGVLAASIQGIVRQRSAGHGLGRDGDRSQRVARLDVIRNRLFRSCRTTERKLLIVDFQGVRRICGEVRVGDFQGVGGRDFLEYRAQDHDMLRGLIRIVDDVVQNFQRIIHREEGFAVLSLFPGVGVSVLALRHFEARQFPDGSVRSGLRLQLVIIHHSDVSIFTGAKETLVLRGQASHRVGPFFRIRFGNVQSELVAENILRVFRFHEPEEILLIVALERGVQGDLPLLG